MTNPASTNVDVSEHEHAHRPGGVGPDADAGAVEVGWLVCENMDDVDHQAVQAARREVVASLRHWLSDYDFVVAIEVREAPGDAGQREPTEYLQWARMQRDIRGWDYVVVFVKPDLVARQRPFAWAVVSRSFDSAIIINGAH